MGLKVKTTGEANLNDSPAKQGLTQVCMLNIHTLFIQMFFLMLQVLKKAFFLPLIGTGEEIRSQYQQLAQVTGKYF